MWVSIPGKHIQAVRFAFKGCRTAPPRTDGGTDYVGSIPVLYRLGTYSCWSVPGTPAAKLIVISAFNGINNGARAR